MKPGIRRTVKIAGLALGALAFLAAAAALLVVFDKPLVRSLIRRQLGRSPGMTVRFARLDYSLFPFRVTIEGLDAGSEDDLQKLSATVARLEAKGDLWKLARGVKPALETVDAQGVSFRYVEKAPSETPVDMEKVLLAVSDTLAWSRRIAVREARLSIALLSGPAEVENLDLTLTAGPAPDVFDYSIGRGDVVVKDAKGAVILATTLKSSGRLGFVSPFTVDVSFALGATRFTLAGAEDALDGLTLSLAARLDRAAQELAVSRLTLDAPGLLNVEGRMTGKQGYGTFVEIEARARFDDLAAVSGLLGPLLPAEIRAATPRGRAGLTGTYVLQNSSQGSKDNLTAALTLEDVDLTPRFEGRPVRVRASGRIDIAGPTTEPRLAADLRAATGPFAAAGLAARGSDWHVAATGTRTGVEISKLEAVLTGLAYDDGANRRVAFDRASLSAKGSVDLGRKEAVLASLDARLPGLAPVRIAGRYGLGRTAPAELRLDTRGLDVTALRALAAPFLPPDLAGWDLGGAIDLSLSVARAPGARDDWTVGAKVALAGAKFNDPSFTVAGEGLDPVLSLDASGSPAKGLAFKAGLDVGKGESLWKAVYVAWEKHPLKIEASGRYLPSTGAIEGLAAHILMPGVGTVEVTGAAGMRPVPAFDLATESRFSLGPLYSLYTQAGVAEAARTKLEGTLAATITVRKSGAGLAVGGRIRLADTNVESPTSKTLLIGVSADLPFRYESAPPAQVGQSRPAGSPDPAKLALEGQSPPGAVPQTVPPTASVQAGTSDAALPESGFFRIGEFQSPFLTLKPVEIPLRAGPNALAIEPFALPLFGGRLELGRTVFRLDPSTGTLAGVGSLALRDVDIARFPIQSPQFRLTGKIQADFPRLDIAPDRIAVSGRGAASVFGGQVVLRDLGVSAPFSAQRTISLNVDLVDLDMKKLTDEVPFGEVTGIVRGEIRDLVISYGQPDRFTFRIESVPRKGVPQTFSLKAVDNLTVLSSGQKASSGGGAFWMSFVRGFRYSKLGIASTLRNDTFTLSGTIHEGGTEYLVKKPSLFGISVVNREPGKKISFREMTSRLKRVGQSDK
jgi:hypothetical protein